MNISNNSSNLNYLIGMAALSQMLMKNNIYTDSYLLVKEFNDLLTQMNNLDQEPLLIINGSLDSSDLTKIAQSSSRETSLEIYNEEKGVNITNVAKLIDDTLKKLNSDQKMQDMLLDELLAEKSETQANTEAKKYSTKLKFAIKYILANGTQEQKLALKTLIPWAETDNAIATHIKALCGSKEPLSGSLTTQLIIKLANGDKDGDGYISSREAIIATKEKHIQGFEEPIHANYNCKYENKFITKSGKIKAGKVNPSNLYGGVVPPKDALFSIKSFSSTVINGTKVYNIQINSSQFISITQNEYEKLKEYINSTGDSATIEGALNAIGATDLSEKEYKKCSYQIFSNELGLQSQIKISKNNMNLFKGLVFAIESMTEN